MYIPNKYNPYRDHSLFVHCISIEYPDAWHHLIEEFVEWIEMFNVKNKCFFGFAQIKTKFGKLTIYMQDYTASWEDPAQWSNDTDKHMTSINEKITRIVKKADGTCRICGRQKEEIVINTKIKMICFKHPEELRKI